MDGDDLLKMLGRTREEFDKSLNEFHAHLDACRQCRDNPMMLCPVGAPLLMAAAVGKKQG